MSLLERTKPAVDHIKVFGSRVIVATYVRDEKTKGGIILPDKPRDEDLHQGKTGMVVALGQHAFQDEEYWEGDSPGIGDWVMYNIQDTRRLVLVNPDSSSTSDSKIECRIMEDTSVQGVVDDPSVVF